MPSVNSDVTAFGTVKKGHLYIQDRRAFDRALAQFRDGSAVELEVTIRRATRSVQLNRFYWGVVVHLLSEYTGFAPDEMHDWLKMRFIPKRLAVCDGNGEIKGEFVLGGSTRKMNTTEFQDYIEQIRQWAASDLSVDIPEPNEAPADDTAGYGAGV